MPRMDSTGDFARSADLRRASDEVIARLEGLGIALNGDESPESLILVLEEVERFEDAVEACGGDLMLDENPPGTVAQPPGAHRGVRGVVPPGDNSQSLRRKIQ